MDLQFLIDQGREKIYHGADHLEVQAELRKLNISDEDIKKAMFVLENDFVRYQLADQERNKLLHRALMGFFFMILGLAYSLYSSIKSSNSYNIDYAIILGGIWYTVRNLLNYRKPIEDFIPFEKRPRRRRFKKKF